MLKNLFKHPMKSAKRASQKLSCVLFAFLPTLVLAELPKMEDPSRGAGKGIMETIKNYAYDAAILAGLVLATVSFYRVASNVISIYGEIPSGKKTWGDLAMHSLIGCILLVVIIWLVTQASDIL
ncbi:MULTISPECIES: TIGR03745 family integrating conjugative element membrane protein [Gallibacterium]|nr:MULTISPECIES: TIGR03745 family integrating conjugative element membrane protein [Gallibacterium]